MRETAHPFYKRFPGCSKPCLGPLIFALLLIVSARAQTASAKAASPIDPLPQDVGAAGLKQALRRLQTTARLMQTVAHPDDEDGGMLTLEARGKGVSTVLFTLNRGEGGQNILGSHLFDVLGVLRTLELTQADRYYGVQQRFTRVADFGYSKNPEETFAKWQGHDIALADMVRVIRTFRPDVLVARFSGTSRDGHGHHQASAILTREAFRAAADVRRFPEQIEAGLMPWQAKKLYIGNVCGYGAKTCPEDDYTVRLNTGGVDSALGESYIQFAVDGLRHQLSQGAGNWSVEPGDRFTYYKLVDSVGLDSDKSGQERGGHEKDFFDGMDTSLPGLADRLGAEVGDSPWLREGLSKIAEKIAEADRIQENRMKAAEDLFAVGVALDELVERSQKAEWTPETKIEVLTRLREKEEQAQEALNLAMDVSMEATVAPASGANELVSEREALTVVSPGQKFTVRVRLHNGSKVPIVFAGATLDMPEGGWVKRAYGVDETPLRPGEDRYANFFIEVPADAVYTRPYWHRDSPETDSLNTIDDERLATLPFPPLQFHARAQYHLAEKSRARVSLLGLAPGERAAASNGGEVSAGISAAIEVPFKDEKGVERKRALAIAPAFSVEIEPGQQVIAVEGSAATEVKVAVRCNLTGAPVGKLHLEVPTGWKAEPAEMAVNLHARGEKQDFAFRISPASLQEGRAQVRAILEAGGAKYSEGYTLVTREDLSAAYYYQPAAQRVSIVDVKLPKARRVGYVMGAGDEIPMVLQQIGMDVTVIPAEKLSREDLSKYGTVVLGIRAYDSQKNDPQKNDTQQNDAQNGVAGNNKRLLEYVAAGGTLVVQYNTDPEDFNAGKFTPYPAQLGHGRVSVEEAPVEILAPEDSFFHYPNAITARDFDGWVQERGLYFMQQWDAQYKPLLASHDPGEKPLQGGLLRASYGKGTYIYAGYAFFRQLPAGVPGAIRLYVNLLSAGQAK